MDLYKIQHELIADRTSAWYRIVIAGPDFQYRWQYGSESSYIIGEHHARAVCREEPSLTVSWGMEVHERAERKELHFDWAESFVDKSIRPFWVDFYWNGALIDRVELARVDGGHGVIPIPDGLMKVSDFEITVAHLIHDLETGREHDNPTRYLGAIGAKRERDRDRQGAGSSISQP